MGILRVILAIAVLFDHMLTSSGEYLNLIFGSLTAVRVFFMISGFYMSLIYITKYSRCENGKFLYYSNRALRLYPTYLTILILVTIVYEIVGRPNPIFSENHWELPLVFATFSNIFIFGADAITTYYNGSPYLMTLPQAWSLGSEVLFYMMVPFIILNRPLVIAVLIAGSISFRVFFDVNDYDGFWNYNFFPSILIFFLLGHISYLIYSKIKDYEMSRYLGIAGIILLLAYIAQRSFAYGNFFLPFLDPYVHTVHGYIFYSIFTIFIPFLFLVSKNSKLDRSIGNLSFSIYLLGTPVIAVAGIIKKDFPSLATYFNHATVLLLTAIIALCIYFLIERPIEIFRGKRIESKT